MGVDLFAVVCQWKDFRSTLTRTGHEAIVVEAANANEALDTANAARPDLWEDHGPDYRRETAVHPATLLSAPNTEGGNTNE